MADRLLIPTREILAARGGKSAVDTARPYAFHVEPECAADGSVVQVATIFLTNRECPLRCLMCDLWRNTTDETVPVGAVAGQIEYALEHLGPAQQIKLYNSGNFSDPAAIPPADYEKIAQHVAPFQRVIVENHPKFCGQRLLQFQKLLAPPLEVALGLETIDPRVLPRLNKAMTLDDFAASAAFLRRSNIGVRAFILLRPPYQTEEEGVAWALRSIAWAFEVGVQCCAVIPTRAGNGVMEQLATQGNYAPPTLASLEKVLEEGLNPARGRVFVDLWDVERFFACTLCGPRRAQRLAEMNLRQVVLPRVATDCPCQSETSGA